jgi:hypothetical protein
MIKNKFKQYKIFIAAFATYAFDLLRFESPLFLFIITT